MRLLMAASAAIAAMLGAMPDGRTQDEVERANLAAKWENTAETDPTTGDTNVYWYRHTDAEWYRHTRNLVPARIEVRCVRKTTEVVVGWLQHVTAGRNAPVLTRVDDQKPLTSTWLTSASAMATVAPQPVPLLKQLHGARRLQAEVTRRDGSTIRADFWLSGIDEAIASVAKACGWTPPAEEARAKTAACWTALREIARETAPGLPECTATARPSR